MGDCQSFKDFATAIGYVQRVSDTSNDTTAAELQAASVANKEWSDNQNEGLPLPRVTTAGVLSYMASAWTSAQGKTFDASHTDSLEHAVISSTVHRQRVIDPYFQ